MLLAESGKPLIQHVHERAAMAPGDPRVIVLTDDDRVEAAVTAYGGEVRRTRPDHASGTDRCAEAAAGLVEPVVVNVQGDEPLLSPEDLGALAADVAASGADIATLGWPFEDEAAMDDPHAVKAVRDADGWALGFTREAARARALAGEDGEILHHVGIYAFRRERLLAFPGLPRTEGEIAERLEQLRALEHGWRLRVLDASRPAFGIDVRADYDRFLAALEASS